MIHLVIFQFSISTIESLSVLSGRCSAGTCALPASTYEELVKACCQSHALLEDIGKKSAAVMRGSRDMDLEYMIEILRPYNACMLDEGPAKDLKARLQWNIDLSLDDG
jgi:hypothetical protein